MNVVFRCPICKASRPATKQIIGRRVRCADCRNFVHVTLEHVETVDFESNEPPYQETGMNDPADDKPFDLTPPSDGDDSSPGEAGDQGAPHGMKSQADPADGPEANAPGSAPGGASGYEKKEAIVRWKEEPDETDERHAEVKFGKDRDRGAMELDMTPMVDVTFLLLIFFMVTASFTLLKTIEQPPPSSEEPSMTFEEFEEDPDYVLVFIDEFNTYTVVYGDLEAEAPSEQELYVRLREAINSGPVPPTKLVVKAHGDASHERVVIAMDAGTEVGLVETDVMMTEQDAL